MRGERKDTLSDTPAIAVEGLTKRFGEIHAVADARFTVIARMTESMDNRSASLTSS